MIDPQPQECQYYILYKVHEHAIVQGLPQLGLEVMFAPLEHIGGGLGKKITVDLLKQWMRHQATKEKPSATELAEKIVSYLEPLVPGEHKKYWKAAEGFINQMAGNIVKAYFGECYAIRVQSKNIVGAETTDCEFLVCAGVQKKSPDYGEWRITGTCKYACTETDDVKCCCGNSRLLIVNGAQGMGWYNRRGFRTPKCDYDPIERGDLLSLEFWPEAKA
jgi:hypothetical protein